MVAVPLGLVEGYLLPQPSEYAAGVALEDCIIELFELVPGVQLYKRRVLDVRGGEELNLVFANDQREDGLRALPAAIPVECKNWAVAVGPKEVAYFAHTVRGRGCDLGILVARSGIAGSDGRGATEEVSKALRDGVRILVLDEADLLELADTDDLVVLLKQRLLDLVAFGAPRLDSAVRHD